MSDFAGVMVKFSGGKAAATLLLAAAILAPPTALGYMDFEVGFPISTIYCTVSNLQLLHIPFTVNSKHSNNV